MAAQITHTISVQLSGSTSLAELKEFVAAVESSGIPNPTIRVQHYAGDVREPGYTTMTASPGRR